MNLRIERLFAPLPHDLRRRLFALLRPGRFAALQQLREGDAGNADAYSLAGYDALRCIYVHVPKAAGVSVTRSLFGNLGGGHMKLSRYQIVFDSEDYSQYFKFTIVRNPWDRLYSAYRFLRAGGMNDSDARWSQRYLSAYRDFRHFVLDGLDDRHVLVQKHLRSQCDYLKPLGSDEPGVDFIGRFESLEHDFRVIAERIGAPARLVHQNRTGYDDDDYRAVYDDTMVERVARVYTEDIELLGYDFDGLADTSKDPQGGRL